MTLLASQNLDLCAGPSGRVDPAEEYVLTLDFCGSRVSGAVWALEDWKAGGGAPLAEVEIAAKHEDDDVFRRLEPDAEGRLDLKPGEYLYRRYDG